MGVDLQKQEQRQNVLALARELRAVEAGGSVRRVGVDGLFEQELSLEELDIAASEFAPYISNV